MSIPSGQTFHREARSVASRVAKLLVLIALAMALLPVSPVKASNNFGVVPGFPTIGVVGQTASAYLHIVNMHASPMLVTDLTFLPSCSNFDVDCAGGIVDPAAFTISPTGVGQAGSGCSNMNFNLTVVDPTSGKVRVRRADNENVSLTAVDIGSDLDVCRVSFTITTNKFANHDARADWDGIQTYQNILVSGVINGTVDTTVNNDVTTVAGPTARMTVNNDFDGDGKSEVTLFGAFGNWMSPGQPVTYFGLNTDVAVPADYNGNGAVERAVFRDGAWYVQGAATVYFGLAGDIPVPGDYDGNGRADRAVYRNGAWYVQGMPTVNFGLAGDIPVPADYDGDGKTDRAVYRNGAWYVEGMSTVHQGLAGDIPVPADYNGDGLTDRAVYRGGAWHIQGMPTVYLGLPGDVPAPGDYDGDGTTDPAVFRAGQWFGNNMPTTPFGAAGDKALGLLPGVSSILF